MELDKKRGCGKTQKKSIAIVDGRKYYSCPLAISSKAQALLGYLMGIQGGMVTPPIDPSPPYLEACRIFLTAAMPKIKPKKTGDLPISMMRNKSDA